LQYSPKFFRNISFDSIKDIDDSRAKFRVFDAGDNYSVGFDDSGIINQAQSKVQRLTIDDSLTMAINEDNMIDKRLNIVTSFGEIQKVDLNNIIIMEKETEEDNKDVMNGSSQGNMQQEPTITSSKKLAFTSTFKNLLLNDEPTEFNVEEFKVKKEIAEGGVEINNPVILVPIVRSELTIRY
jgi:hypothetical protein